MATLYVRIPDEVMEWIRDEAKARDQKISAFVNRLLRKKYKKAMVVRLQEETIEDG